MGKWAEHDFGKSRFGEIGIILAGTATKEFEETLLGFFDETISHKDNVYHCYLAKKNKVIYPLVSNVYGAPAVLDILTVMHDGGCRIVLFVGYAYGGFKNLEVGSIVIPNKSYHFDGIYHPIEPDREFSEPDKDLKQKVEDLLKNNDIKYVEGTNISVPAVTFQLPHANEHYQKIQPFTVEMELAACLSRAKDIGIRVVGTLIISDNRASAIADETKKEKRRIAKMELLKLLIDHIENFKLPYLPAKQEFKIDEYLAYVIEDPEDKTNIYRKNDK